MHPLITKASKTTLVPSCNSFQNLQQLTPPVTLLQITLKAFTMQQGHLEINVHHHLQPMTVTVSGGHPVSTRGSVCDRDQGLDHL